MNHIKIISGESKNEKENELFNLTFNFHLYGGLY
jgi:hypothetical protein